MSDKPFLYTAVGRYYHVYVDGEEFSKHTTEREAVENANLAIQENPGAEVFYRHIYDVRVIQNVVVVVPPPAPITGPFATDAVAETTDFSGTTIYETSKNTSALFQAQIWNVQGRYTFELYGIDSRIALTPIAGGDFTFNNAGGAPSGVYPFNARVWDAVAGAVIYDTAADGGVNPQVTIP